MKPLGFIIISYNRCADALELVRNISGLDRASELLEEVILVNNASTEDYSAVIEYMKSEPSIPFRYYDAPENLGVAKGRNFALQKSSAPLLVMIDDDAVLQNKDCLVNLVEEFGKQNTSRPKAIVSFKVLYYETGEIQKNALPHKRFNEYKNKSFFETYYFAGGAHAVKKEVMERLGNYPDDFFYGMEEYDLAYRILDSGYSIVYSDRIIMLHKESPLGRRPKHEKLEMMWVNKATVAYRYLPKRYFYSTAFMWSLQYLRLTNFMNVKGYLSGWRRIWKIPVNEIRQPLSESTLSYLKELKARLWY